MTPVTVISSVVSVPVLSRQSTSTLASVSMQYISCTSTFLDESLIIDTARTELVRRIIPFGIIPTSDATVLITADCNVSSGRVNCLIKNAMPIGKSTNVQILIMKLNDSIIWEFTFLIYLASLFIFAA